MSLEILLNTLAYVKIPENLLRSQHTISYLKLSQYLGYKLPYDRKVDYGDLYLSKISLFTNLDVLRILGFKNLGLGASFYARKVWSFLEGWETYSGPYKVEGLRIFPFIKYIEALIKLTDESLLLEVLESKLTNNEALILFQFTFESRLFSSSFLGNFLQILKDQGRTPNFLAYTKQLLHERNWDLMETILSLWSSKIPRRSN